MKKQIPVYVLLVAILAVLVLNLREMKAIKTELQSQSMELDTQTRALRRGISVTVDNEPLHVRSER